MGQHQTYVSKNYFYILLNFLLQIPENTRFGHPKFYKLCDILLAHFTQHHKDSSRVIVFCEYRESVMEAYALLLQQKPLIKPKVFIGQGAITQRQQLNVIFLIHI